MKKNNDLADDYHTSFILNFVSYEFLSVMYVFYCLTVLGRYCRVVYYIMLFIFDFLICLFFSLKINFLTNKDIFDNEYYSFSD